MRLAAALRPAGVRGVTVGDRRFHGLLPTTGFYPQQASTRNSIFARWASRSSTGRNCRRCSVRGKTRARRNSTARHYTSSWAYSPACRGLLPSHHRLERCRWAADDSRAGSRSHASERRVTWARRTQRLAAATRELRSIRITCATLLQRIRSAVQMRFKSRALQLHPRSADRGADQRTSARF